MADDEMVMIRGCKSAQAATVLLRGANDYMLDEVDRSLHDAFCVVKRVLEFGTVVPGDVRLHAPCPPPPPFPTLPFSPPSLHRFLNLTMDHGILCHMRVVLLVLLMYCSKFMN